MRRHVLAIPLFVLALSGGAASGAWPQALELASRGPRFFAAWKPSEAVDVSNAVVLRRRVSLDLTNVTADEALKEITRQADLEISYSNALLPNGRSVSVYAREITVAAALTEVLLDAEVDVAVARGGHMALVKRPALVAVPAFDSGVVVGRVTDKATGAPIVGAAVVIEGTPHTATTGADGEYRLANALTGTYEVSARYIGYLPLSASVTVATGSEAVIDFALVKSVQVLDEVVTTGTFLPTEVKALPTPITVISSSDIERLQPRTVTELFREAVPGAVGWDFSNTPYQTNLSVRGASTLVGGGQTKIIVDGVEASRHTAASVDPSSIERMEIVRGPQAAAIYGSEAIGGVIQIFTKRGDAGLSRPQVNGEVALGVLQTPYAGFNDVLRQRYRVSVRSGGTDVGYNLGAGYTSTADWLPNGELSAQSNPSVFGGLRIARGIVAADVSGRYYVHNSNAVFNPELTATGFIAWSRPNFLPVQNDNSTLGATLTVTPIHWWTHSVTAGLDRVGAELIQARQRLLFPGDSLLFANNSSTTKRSASYRTAVQGMLGTTMSGSLTVGFDHWSLLAASFSTSGAYNTTGTIQVAPGQSVFLSRTTTTNTGYLGQAQLSFRDALFLTAGVRAEDNSDFGDNLGAPLSPRVGFSYVRPVGEVTVKLRGSWGRAIRAPQPGLKLGGVFGVAGAGTVLPNAALAPERQQGWDAGLELVLGSRGALSATYYRQIADDLIQFVVLPSTSVPMAQNQNVGRVRNSGIEVEGSIAAGPLSIKGQYAHTLSRVQQLGPTYTGDLRPGDHPLGTPKHTAGASVAFFPTQQTTVTGGLTYIGSWTEYDWLAWSRCLGATGICRNDTFALDRSYFTSYSGYTRLSASVSQKISRLFTGFISVDNLTNNQAYELSNINAVWGRLTTFGFRAQY